MKIPLLHLHDAITDWLRALFFGGECIGYQRLNVPGYLAVPLTIPPSAQYALCIAEANPLQADRTKVMRFLENGSFPNAIDGMPLGDLGIYEIKGRENMQRFRVIGIDPFITQSLRIQYYA